MVLQLFEFTIILNFHKLPAYFPSLEDIDENQQLPTAFTSWEHLTTRGSQWSPVRGACWRSTRCRPTSRLWLVSRSCFSRFCSTFSCGHIFRRPRRQQLLARWADVHDGGRGGHVRAACRGPLHHMHQQMQDSNGRQHKQMISTGGFLYICKHSTWISV